MRPTILPLLILLCAAPVAASSLPPVVGPYDVSHGIQLNGGSTSDTTAGLGTFRIAAGGSFGKALIGASPLSFVKAYATVSGGGTAQTDVQLIYNFSIVAANAAAGQALRDYYDTMLPNFSVINGGDVVGTRAGVQLTGTYDTFDQGGGQASINLQAGDEVGFKSACHLYQEPCGSGGFTALGRLDYADPLTFTGYVYLFAEAIGGGFGATNGSARAFLDPVISLNTGAGFAGDPNDYTIYVSPGVGNGGGAVPEPSEWALLMMGLGAVGMATRQRRVALG